MRRSLVVGLGFLCLATLSVGVAGADCADKKLFCVKLINGKVFNDGLASVKGRLTEGQCWKNWSCSDCNGESYANYAAKCNAQFSGCEGNCVACQLYSDVERICGPCIDKNGTNYYGGY